MLKSALRFSHVLLEEILQEGDVTVDATMGNGNDTVLLSLLVGSQGVVHAFDIQEQALLSTKEALAKANCTAELHLESHEHAFQYLSHNLKAAIFNLGYLPKGDKSIITKPKSTINAITSLLEHLVLGGRIVLVLYYGHDGGDEEKDAVIDFVKELNQHEYQVLQYQFLNQHHAPPILLCIEKRNLQK